MQFVPAGLLSNTEQPVPDVVPVFLISLDECRDRRDRLLARGLPADWVHNYWPAHDLRNSCPDDLRSHINTAGFEAKYKRSPTGGEVGCLASHRAAQGWLAESGYPVALFLEDDIVPQPVDWMAQLAQTTAALTRDAKTGVAAMCNLGHPARVLRGTSRYFTHLLPRHLLMARFGVFDRTYRHNWLSHALVMTRPAAERLVRIPACRALLTDDWPAARKLGAIDRTYLRRHALFVQDPNAPSLIGPR